MPVRSKPARCASLSWDLSPNSIAASMPASSFVRRSGPGRSRIGRANGSCSSRLDARCCISASRHCTPGVPALSTRTWCSLAVPRAATPWDNSQSAYEKAPGSRYTSGSRRRTGTSISSPHRSGTTPPVTVSRSPPVIGCIVERSGVTCSTASRARSTPCISGPLSASQPPGSTSQGWTGATGVPWMGAASRNERTAMTRPRTVRLSPSA